MRVERFDFVGFWYLLLLIIGIGVLIAGALKKDVSYSVKMVIMLFVLGILFIIVSIFLLLPGSDEIISELLGLN